MSLTAISLLQTIVNVSVHCVGLYLLICVHNAGRNGGKTLFEQNLSIVGIVINIILTVILVLVLFGMHSVALVTGNIIWSILLIFCTRIGYVCINKLLEQMFNMVYRAVYSNKVAVILVISWISACVYCAGIMFTLDFKMYYMKSHLYFILAMDLVFVIATPATHTYVYYHYKRARASHALPNNAGRESTCLPKPCLHLVMIVVFIIFSAFPQFVFIFIRGEIDMSDQTTMFATLVFNIVSQFCILSDVILYMLAHQAGLLRMRRERTNLAPVVQMRNEEVDDVVTSLYSENTTPLPRNDSQTGYLIASASPQPNRNDVESSSDHVEAPNSILNDSCGLEEARDATGASQLLSESSKA